MKLSIATLLFGAAAVSASSNNNNIRANSKVGRSLMSKARQVGGRALEDNNMSWAANYSLRFEKCATTTDYYGGYFGGNQNQNNNNNNRANYNGMYEQRLVHFKLCPSDTCGNGCSGGGDYVIEMNEFVQAYMEYKEEAKEAECEAARENCDCENANDDEACETQCLMSAGLYDQCVEEDQNNNNNNNGQQEEEFELERALECGKLEIDEEAAQYYAYKNGNQQQYYNQQQQQQAVEFFVGPYCSANGKKILLGVFMDETCSFTAPDGIYEKFHYGKELPYSSTSIIDNDCISCMEPVEEDENNNNGNNNNNNNNQQQAEVLEVCERLYEPAGKCESNLNVYGVYPNTLACDFIHGLNSWGKTRIAATFKEAKKNVTPSVLAGVFAVTTVFFGGVSYYLHKKLERNNVGLVHGGGDVMA